MKYKTVEHRNKVYSVGDKVFVLNGGIPEEKYIIDIFDDKPFDDSDYETKCCYLSNEMYGGRKSFARLEECLYDSWDINRAIDTWQREYDMYVCRDRII